MWPSTPAEYYLFNAGEVSSVGEDEIMAESKYTLPDIEQREVIDSAAVFS